jgi:hypothetical protein
MATTLTDLIGKTMWTCRRAADMATFQFGRRIPVNDYFNRPTEIGEYALHVQCSWRIAQGDLVLVGSRDLLYPAHYSDNDQIPEHFDWDRQPNRRDRLLSELFQDGRRGLAVIGVDVGTGDAPRIRFGEGYSLQLFPDDSLGHEHWRLLAAQVDGAPAQLPLVK